MRVPALTDGRTLFGALFVCASAVVFAYLIATAPTPPPPEINVRWRGGVSAPQREALEKRYKLAAPQPHGTGVEDQSPAGRTWTYQILDTSTGHIRQLVQDPLAEDTAHIDRRRFQVEGTGPSTVMQLLWACLAGLAIAAFATPFGLDRTAGLAAAMTRGIPDLRADVLGVFRVCFAAFLFIAVSTARLKVGEGFAAEVRSFRWEWVDWLLTRPDLVRRLEDGILVLLVLFAVGLWTRLVYVLMAAALSVWIAVMLQQPTNIHAWEATYLTVLCLLPVPWGAALSVDAVLRHRAHPPSDREEHGKRYGFAVWVPGFVLGAVWAGAAYSKLAASGFDWILGGAVKYHWVIDARGAPVQWGLWVASHHWAAVILSFFGVALEAVFIVAAFARTSRSRTALACAIGLPLLVGFYLFHNVLWWTWWLVLLSFAIPWQPLVNAWRRHRTSSAAASGLRPIHAVVVTVVCLLMLTELPAGFGRFGSYSNTYASTEDFDTRNPIKGADQLWLDHGSPRARQVREELPGARIVGDAISRRSRREAVPPAYLPEMVAFRDALRREYGAESTQITLIREAFDWEAGRFVPGRVVGSVDIDLVIDEIDAD